MIAKIFLEDFPMKPLPFDIFELILPVYYTIEVFFV